MMMTVGFAKRVVAACTVVCGLSFVATMPACETVGNVIGTGSSAKRDNPNQVATVEVPDPQADGKTIPVRVEARSDEGISAIKDIQVGDIKKAADGLEAALKERESKQKTGGTAQELFILGATNEALGNFEKAAEFYKQSNRAESTADAQAGVQRCNQHLGK